MIKLPLKPGLNKHNVIARFSFVKCFFGYHLVKDKVCVRCGKTGFGMPVYPNPPLCPPPKKR